MASLQQMNCNSIVLPPSGSVANFWAPPPPLRPSWVGFCQFVGEKKIGRRTVDVLTEMSAHSHIWIAPSLTCDATICKLIKRFFSCQKKKQVSNDAFAGLNILKLAAPITNQKCEQLNDANSVNVREYVPREGVFYKGFLKETNFINWSGH